MDGLSRIPELPLDVVDVIMAELVPADEIAGNKKALKACSLVCKTWRQLSVPHLFHSISFCFMQWAIKPPEYVEVQLEMQLTEHDKGWVSKDGKILVAVACKPMTRPSHVFDSYLAPLHRFDTLSNHFKRRPDVCRYIRSVRLVGAQCSNPFRDPPFRGPRDLRCLAMELSPVDKELFVATLGLFPNLQRLHMQGMSIAGAPLVASPNITAQGSESAPISLSSLSVDFRRDEVDLTHHHLGPENYDAGIELTKIINCFEDFQHLTVTDYDNSTHVLNSSFIPASRLRSLSYRGEIKANAGVFTNNANFSSLQFLSASMYPMSREVLQGWNRLLQSIGPQLKHLQCLLTYENPLRESVALPFLSTSTNLSTLKLVMLPPLPSCPRWCLPSRDVLESMFKSYLAGTRTSRRQLEHVSVAYLDDESDQPWQTDIPGSLAVGKAMIELAEQVVGLRPELTVQTLLWRDFLIELVSPIHQLSQAGCVKLQKYNTLPRRNARR